MKKLLLFACGFAIALISHSQTILTYKSHGLIPNEKNPMLLTKYVDPGVPGQNVIWDFSNLEATNDFVGNIQEPLTIKGINKFSEANTVLEEFGNHFYFIANSNQMEQIGYSTGNGSIYIEYTKPFVKMRYPFSYNSSYTGVFEGTYNSSDKQIGEISGTYEVTGDGIGTLLLPGGKSLKNVLRVKEVKNYKQVFNSSSVNIEDITYRWYINEHRFPVLVFINSTYTYENGQTSSSTRAAYNSNVINDLKLDVTSNNSGYNLEIYPNPYSEKVNINLRLDTPSNVKIVVYDLIGKKIAVLTDSFQSEGELNYTFSAKEMGLAKGTYIVKVKVNNHESSNKIIEL